MKNRGGAESLKIRNTDVVALMDALVEDHREHGNLSADYTTNFILRSLDRVGLFNKETVQEALFSALDQDRRGKWRHPLGLKLSSVIDRIERDNEVKVDKEFSLIEKETK